MSCRYFQIGVEEFILLYLKQIANRRKISINYQQTEYNSKVEELLQKYSNVFKNNVKDNNIIIEFAEDTINNIKNNTRLKKV